MAVVEDSEDILDLLVNFWDWVVSFFSNILSVFNYILDILKTIRFWMTSLLTSVYQLAEQFFNSWFFS